MTQPSLCKAPAALIFDMDGTMVDSMPFHQRSWIEFAQRRGLSFDEAKALEILKRDEVTITLDLQQGDVEVTEWTCDLTEDYIRINADYRT